MQDDYALGDPLFAVDALRRIETQAALRLGDAAELMRRAGQSAWQVLLAHWPQARRIVVVCGPGNNGGDGYELACHAHESGRDVTVVRLPAHGPHGRLAIDAAGRYTGTGGRVVDSGERLSEADLIVDAMFGIGLSRAPEADAAGLIDAINAAGVPVLALDVPSGVDADSGAVPDAAVRAERTVEFIVAKAGLATGRALDHAGICKVAGLGLIADDFAGTSPRSTRLQAVDLMRWLQPRRRDTHKGGNGRVLCIGGDHGHGGAILLTAEAALRCGAGLVDVVTRPAHVPALLARRPEAMVHGVDDAALSDSLLDGCDVIAIGPGLGQEGWGRRLFEQALCSDRPLVLDADALNLLARKEARPGAQAVLTPHPGEAARLLGRTTQEVQADRFRAAEELACRYGCVVVLKGAGTVIAAPGERSRVLAAGNPGMAVGGMGDVLCGVTASLCGQGLAPFDAACCGALLHSAAGDRAAAEAGERGLLPSDLMPWLRRLANPEICR